MIYSILIITANYHKKKEHIMSKSDNNFTPVGTESAFQYMCQTN